MKPRPAKSSKPPVGRPSDYSIELCEQAHTLAQQGATDREIAQHLGVNQATYYRWRNSHPEFREAIRLGKEGADQRVESALYHRAVGYTFDSLKILQHDGKPVLVPYAEHVPPDVSAAKMWLTNRKPTEWREKSADDPPPGLNVDIDIMSIAKSVAYLLQLGAQRQSQDVGETIDMQPESKQITGPCES